MQMNDDNCLNEVDLAEELTRLFPTQTQEYACGEQIVVAPTEIDPSKVDALLARELNALSMQDRNRAMEDIHGVLDDVSNDEILHDKPIDGDIGKNNDGTLSPSPSTSSRTLPTLLPEMQTELDKIPIKQAYDEAVAMGQSVSNPMIYDNSFRLRFLRAEYHDPEKAALRLVNYMDLLKEVFGSYALTRPIRLADLTDGAISILKEGSFRVVPHARDTAGRRILAIIGDVGALCSINDRIQVTLYLSQCLADDEVTQQRGAVFLVFLHKKTTHHTNNHEALMAIYRAEQCIPIRRSGTHICLPSSMNPIYSAMKATYMLLSKKENRTRTRFHIGSPTECCYSLKSFGIPADTCIPPNLYLRSKEFMQSCLKWIEFRQAYEELKTKQEQGEGSDDFSNIVECPNSEDCLFGKGSPIMKHPGNIAMRNLLEPRWESYDIASYTQKTQIAWEVVQEIQRGGGRFLREDPNGYWFVEVSADVARKKISLALRDAVRRNKSKQQPKNPMQTNEEQPFRQQQRHGTTTMVQGNFSDGLDLSEGISHTISKRRRMLSITSLYTRPRTDFFGGLNNSGEDDGGADDDSIFCSRSSFSFL